MASRCGTPRESVSRSCRVTSMGSFTWVYLNSSGLQQATQVPAKPDAVTAPGESAPGRYSPVSPPVDEPGAKPVKEIFARVAFQPRKVSATFQLMILELRQVRPQGGGDRAPRMRIVRPVEHQDGGFDGRKRRRIFPLRLLAQHIAPGLRVTFRVAGGNLGVLRQKVVRVYRREEEAGGAHEPLVGIGRFVRDLFKFPLQVGLDPPPERHLKLPARLLPEGAATDQGNPANQLGMLRGEGECQHRSPGRADEGGAVAVASLLHQ